MIDRLEDIPRAKRVKALSMSTLAFTACFAVWTILSIIGVRLQQELGLSDSQLGLLVATPILTGSLSRIMLGIWTDQLGARIVFAAVMLSAALATYLLSYAGSFPMILLAGLGIGFAGGSFAVGVGYVARWYPSRAQGAALGVFGTGNVGAAVTSLVAPFVLVAFGWQTVARSWAAALALVAVAFWLVTEDDPGLKARRLGGAERRSVAEQLGLLRRLQIWRFSIYYGFTFGGFVALTLWLPRYLIGVYDLDLTTAGMITTFYSVPASLARAYGGHLADKYGARTVMYLAFGVATVVTLLLSYPQTDYVIHGIEGPIAFSTRMALVPFVALIFVLGFVMSFGSAAVYKHIPVYYEKDIGVVGGTVGMVGGLGGFFLPIAFGVLADLTGIWTSCFMLLFALVATPLAWMHFAILRMERAAVAAALRELPDLPEMLELHDPTRHRGHGP